MTDCLAASPLAKQDSILILDGGQAPESQTGPIRRFSPDLILFVDVAWMGQPPGEICWLPWQESAGISASSHTLPPYMLAQYLVAELECEVALLGIQPLDLSLESALSMPVHQAVGEVCKGLTALLGVKTA